MITQRAKTLGVGTKSIDRRYVEHVCNIVRELVDRDFKEREADLVGNQTWAAKRIGVSQAQISDLYNRKAAKGIGLATLLLLRSYTGRTLDDLLGLPPSEEQATLDKLQASINALRAAAPKAQAPPHEPRPDRPRRAADWKPIQEANYIDRAQKIKDAERAEEQQKKATKVRRRPRSA